VPALAEYPDLQRVAEAVSFPSRDGTKLEGWYMPGEKPATIILVHGYGCRRQEMLRHADFLHEAGYSVLLFDLRSRGESAGDAVTLGYHERGDALAAVDYLRGRPDTLSDRVGVLGVSLGGATAILAATESEAIRAVVAESTFRSVDSVVSQSFTRFIGLPAFPFAPLTIWLSEQRLGIDSAAVAPEREVAKIAPRPVLVIHGSEDETISPRDGEAVFAAAGAPKQWWLIPNAGHADGVKVAPEEYGRRVVEFFDLHLQ
jgi:fermentation-respiration switch protein FrsA (DUF1100 family)